MAAPSVVILPPSPPSVALSPHNAHWRQVLLNELAQIETEMWAELHDAHPGARHCITGLIARGADCRQQLARLGVGA